MILLFLLLWILKFLTFDLLHGLGVKWYYTNSIVIFYKMMSFGECGFGSCLTLRSACALIPQATRLLLGMAIGRVGDGYHYPHPRTKIDPHPIPDSHWEFFLPSIAAPNGKSGSPRGISVLTFPASVLEFALWVKMVESLWSYWLG